ncbi:hypothetical protein CXZ10_15695 [Pleomorphomonas diazotrophica]|uniref:Uncharacterized protein n=1 Tax=Pleomorphomonas diazotrophica TaxID=1166257 RepID=A0A1I4W024_9HYPH|nr:hypothetical protein [Pleomorphomonas diazotrophica]PKR88239.1 hypothetical protein CXZ10_15695 [Pleomorphomonas diazotrophica]SFN06914.1 hypothetical protein SAMN05192571_11458 [Pleomorphomonas diazotrophica]
MKIHAAAAALLCLSASVFPASADAPPAPSDKFPGWVTTTRDTGTVFFYCAAPKICGEGSIVSFHFHDLPAPSKAEIRAKYKEPRLPITCRNAGSYDTCEYPNAIDKKGRPTHWRPMPEEGFEADFFHSGFLSAHMPAGSKTHFLITLSSSAASYKLSKKNYALFRTDLGKALGHSVASLPRASK